MEWLQLGYTVIGKGTILNGKGSQRLTLTSYMISNLILKNGKSIRSQTEASWYCKLNSGAWGFTKIAGGNEVLAIKTLPWGLFSMQWNDRRKNYNPIMLILRKICAV